jgi:hypothetical protein
MRGQIFISYRREESKWSARSLYDRLVTHFERKQIFMDVDTLKPGVDFFEAIEKSVGSCDVLIAVIGAHWVNAADEQGRRRLDNPEDFVRMEIATALSREVRVIPVLVDGASMPKTADLPDDLKPLVRRNALPVSDTRFDDDCRRLVATIVQVFEVAEAERSVCEGMARPITQSSATHQDELLRGAGSKSEGGEVRSVKPSSAGSQNGAERGSVSRQRPVTKKSGPSWWKRLPWWIWALCEVALCVAALAGLALWLFVGEHSKPHHTLPPKPSPTALPKSTPTPLPPTPTPAPPTPIPSTPTPSPSPTSTPTPTPSPTAALATPVDPRSEVSEFVRRFWGHCVSEDASDWASDFADQVRYCYNPGRVTERSFIRTDRLDFLNRYPLRHYEFSDPTIQVEPGNRTARVTFSFNYRYSGRKPAQGTCRTTLNVERNFGTWFITEYDEQVSRQ